MYNYIKGKLIEVSDSIAVIEAGGVGYELSVSALAAASLMPKIGSEVTLCCHLSVREDDMSLFGFADKREKAMFLKLIEVSGVGPKLALAVLGGMNVEQLAAAIMGADVKSLSHIKGVGKKTAERIALELRDKIGKEYSGEVTAAVPVPAAAANANEDAVMALMTLGYTRQEASAAVTRVQQEGMTLEQLVYAAIKNA